MKSIKRILAMVLAVCLIASAAGCIVQVNQEKNRAIVVAEIDGKYEILKGDYLDLFTYQYAYYMNLYAQLGMQMTSEQLKTMRQSCIDALVDKMIEDIEMEKVNFETNDDDRKKAEEKLEEDIKKLAEQYEEDAKKEAEKKEEEDKKNEEDNKDGKENNDSDKDDGKDDSDKNDDKEDGKDETPDEERDFMKEAREYYDKLIKDSGMTKEEYIEEAAREFKLERFKEYMTKDVSIKDEDVKKKYDELLDEQKLTPNVDADVVVYTPAGVSYKYIKVMLTTEEQKEYDKLIEDEKKDDAADYIKEKSKAIADAYLERIKKGEKFEDVMDDANKYLIEKCGQTEESIKKSDEVLKLYRTIGSTGFAGELDSKLVALGDNEVTAVLDAQKGVYVIGKCYGRFDAETKEYAEGNEVYNAIKDSLKKAEQETAWDKWFEETKNSHKIKIYSSRINKNY